MPNHYNEQGNIPGPNDYEAPLHPDEQGLANLKKLSWEGFKWAVPGGSIADVFFDQDQRGDLKITKQPQIHQIAHPAIQLVAQKAGSEFFNTRITPHRPLSPTGAIIKNKPVDERTGANILDNIFNWRRFSNNNITERERLLESNVTGMVTEEDPIALGRQEFDEGSIPGLDGEDYAFESTLRQGPNESNKDYIKRYWDTKFDELGIPEGVRFSLREMLDSDHLTKAQRRNIKSGISNPNYVFRDYKVMRAVLVNDFLDGLEGFDIDPSTIEIHHISSLRHIAQLFEGLPRSEWPDMLAELYKSGLATGNDPDNLMAMFAKAHRSGESSNIDSVHRYLDNELGKYNELITGNFGDEIRDLDVGGRVPFIKRYAEIRQSSVQVANNAIRQVLDEVALDQEGGIDALLDNIVFSEDQIEYIQSQIKKHLDMKFNPQGWGALSDSLEDDVSGAKAKQDRGLSPSGPTQGQLMDLGKKKSNKKKTSKNQKKYFDDPDVTPPPNKR
jgi:hypothetical protein